MVLSAVLLQYERLNEGGSLWERGEGLGSLIRDKLIFINWNK